MSAAQDAWFNAQLDLDPDSLVFIDETAAATNMVQPYGRSEQGERCRISVSHGRYKTTTVTATLRTSGFVATTLFNGATSGARFLAYVSDTLVPVLKRGDTVILDNLSVHKLAGVRETIEATEACLFYLPAYSPDFNPNRASLRQTEGTPANGGGAHRPRPLGRDPKRLQSLPPARMPKLHRRCWTRCLQPNMTGNGFSEPSCSGLLGRARPPDLSGQAFG